MLWAQAFAGHFNSTGRRIRIGRGARLRAHDYHAHLAAWAVANLASVGCARDIAGSAVAVTIPASGSLVTHRGRRSRAPERCAMPNSSFKPNPLRGSPASDAPGLRSEEHTSELQSLMRISYAVFCLKQKNNYTRPIHTNNSTL